MQSLWSPIIKRGMYWKYQVILSQYRAFTGLYDCGEIRICIIYQKPTILTALYEGKLHPSGMDHCEITKTLTNPLFISSP
jgi:hypothetical protein